MISPLNKSYSSQKYKLIENILRDYHPMQELHADLHREIKIILEDIKKRTRIINFRMYTIAIDYKALKQTSQIPDGIFLETCKYKLVWENNSDYETISKPKEIEYTDFDCDTFIKWDNPKLPLEVSQNACEGYMHTDEIILVEDLIKYYGKLDNINYGDFPKALIPLVKKSLIKYQNFIKKT